MRWIALLLLVTACGDDSSSDDAPTVTAGSSGSMPATTSGSPTTDGTSSTQGVTTGDGTGTGDTTGDTGTPTTDPTATTGGGLDCTAPADCETCWRCAVMSGGPCQAGYDACLFNPNCAGTMVCIESMCTEGALAQMCLDTCCMSCTNLGTCGEVDPTVQCVATQCAGLCDAPTCP